MTQFALALTKKGGDGLVPVSMLRDDFLLETAGKLFKGRPSEEIFVLDVDGKDIDCLMLEAQRLIIASSEFEETTLYRAIRKITPTVDELVFWYGSDYEDLDYVYDVAGLVSKLEESVNESNCELYLHYKKAN